MSAQNESLSQPSASCGCLVWSVLGKAYNCPTHHRRLSLVFHIQVTQKVETSLSEVSIRTDLACCAEGEAKTKTTANKPLR